MNEPLAAEGVRYAPALVTRAQWQAKAATTGMKEQKPVGIVIHHTAVAQNAKVSLEAKMRNLQAFSQRPGQVSPKHTKPAWPDVPYHFYLDLTGRIAEGRDVRFAGDTNTGYDTVGYIQVVLEGDFEKETPAPEQLSALKDVLVWLMLSWNVPPDKIGVHKDHAPTTCPGRNFTPLVAGLLVSAADRRGKVISESCARNPGPHFAQAYCSGKSGK